MSILQFSTKIRGDPGQWIEEITATAGRLLVIVRAPANRVAAMELLGAAIGVLIHGLVSAGATEAPAQNPSV